MKIVYSFLLIALFAAGCNDITVKMNGVNKTIGASITQKYSVESTSDGTGVELNSLTLEVGTNYNLYAIKRSSSGSFIDNLAVSWSKNGSGGNLTILGAGEASEFVPVSPGVVQVAMSVNGVQVKVITITVVPIAYPALNVSNLVISGISSTGFTGTIDFTGGSPAQIHTLYYCNNTATPGCVPTSGSSATMTVSGGTYTASVTGLTNPGNVFNVRVVSTDSVTVTGSPMNTTATLLYNNLAVSGLAISSITSSGFRATINYTGGTPSQSHTVYYCNATLSPGCDPSMGLFSLMIQSGATYYANLTGLTSPTNSFNVRVVSTDIVTVTGSPQNATTTLLGTVITLTNEYVTFNSKTGFTVDANFTGDVEQNSIVRLYYCNKTDNSSCVATSGTMVVMTRSGTKFTTTVTGLSNPWDEGDDLRMSIVATDPDGTSGSPLTVSSAFLADLRLEDLNTGNMTRSSFTLTSNFVESNTNGAVTLYYCNETLSPGCNPLLGESVAMVRGVTNFSVTVSGLSGPSYSEGDLVNVRMTASDPDGVKLKGIVTRQIRLTGITTSNAQVYRIEEDKFYVGITYSGDANNNQISRAYYCNETKFPGCNPLAETPITLTKNTLLEGQFTNVLAANDPGDTLTIIVQTTDADGVYADGVVGSPSTMNLTMKVPMPISIYRSVGPARSTSLADSASIGGGVLTLSAGVATFSGSLPSNIGVGDAIVYDSNGAGSNPQDSIAFIHGRSSATTYTVRTASGLVPNIDFSNDEDWTIYRAYTSLNSAVSGSENAGIPAGLRNFDTWTGGVDISSQTGLDLKWNIALYAEVSDDTTPVVIQLPWKLDWGNKLHIFTPNLPTQVGASQRHTGIWDENLYILRSNQRLINVNGVNRVMVEGLQMRLEGSTNSVAMMYFSNKSEKFMLTKNLIRSSSTGTDISGFRSENSRNGANANNVYFGFSTLNSYALNLYGEINSTYSAHYNNTFYNNYVAIRYTTYNNYQSSSAKNNLALDCISACYVLPGSSVNPQKNAASDSTVALNVGAANLHLEDPANMNFRLLSTSSVRGQGYDLSSDPNSIYSFTDDFQSDVRIGGSWDIGADQN